MTINRVVNYE